MTWELVVLILGIWWSLIWGVVQMERAKRPSIVDLFRGKPDGET